MSFWGYLRGVGNALLNRTQYTSSAEALRREITSEERYGSLDARYENRDYEEIAELLKDSGQIPEGYGAIKSLRNPVPLTSDVHAANLMADDQLEHLIVPEDSNTDVDKLRELVRMIWAGSEWEEEARHAFPTHGELWEKAVSSPDRLRVYKQILDPRYITDFDKDERDYLTFLRIDIPRERRTSTGEIEDYLHVEVWDKERATFRVYEVDPDKAGPDSPLEDLDEFLVKSLTLGESPTGDDEGFTGYDFIPVVHTRFRRLLGRKRGITPFEHVLVNIDRLNELVTKLHDLMFPDVSVVLTRDAGAGGETLPPIELEGLEAQAAITEAQKRGIDIIELANEKIISLPSGASLDYKIPPIDFAEHAALIEAESKEIERQVPELAYYRLRELELSGRAIKLTLRDLIDRIRAARQNFERGQVRFNQMAISIGQALKIEGFNEVGTFKEKALDHSFEDRDVFLPSEEEEAQTDTVRAQALQAFADLSTTLLEEVLAKQGYEQAKVKKIAAEAAASAAAKVPALDLSRSLGLPQEPSTAQGDPAGDQETEQ